MQNARKLIIASLAAVAVGLGAAAETSKEIAELFGRADAIGNPQISPNGKYLAVECSPEVKPSICIFDIATGAAPILVPVIADVRLESHYWANNETIVMNIEAFETVKTSDGLQNYAFDRAVAFNLRDKKPVMLMNNNRAYLDTNDLAAVLPEKEGAILFSLVTSEGGEKRTGEISARSLQLKYNIMEVSLKKGGGKRVKVLSRNVVDAVVSPAGDVIAEVSYQEITEGNYTVAVRVDGNDIFKRERVSQNPLSVWGLDSSGQNILVYLRDGEFYGLHRMSLADGALTPVSFDSALGGGTVGPIFDHRNNRVIGFELPGDDSFQVIEEAALKSQIDAIAPAMPGASVTLESWTDDRSQSVIRVEKTGSPAEYYLFEAGKGALSPVGSIAPHLDGRPLGKIAPISYTARDGMTIESYLTLPPGKTRSDGPFPLILLPHGGPEARDTAGFDWWAQAYATAGYAVLQPNFRGSSGYGVDFLSAGYGEFGGKMVLDVVDGAKWAVSQGITTQGQVCAAGASYGGYSALMTGLHAPDDIKCIVAVNAVTNPFAILGDYRDKSLVANYFERYLGVGKFDRKEEKDAISPVERAGEFTQPVLLIGSEEDSTVPFEQSEQLMRAGRSTNQFTLVNLSGEDHYLNSTRARHDVLESSLNFLQQHLPAK